MKFFMPQFDRYVRDMFKKMGHSLVDSERINQRETV